MTQSRIGKRLEPSARLDPHREGLRRAVALCGAFQRLPVASFEVRPARLSTSQRLRPLAPGQRVVLSQQAQQALRLAVCALRVVAPAEELKPRRYRADALLADALADRRHRSQPGRRASGPAFEVAKAVSARNGIVARAEHLTNPPPDDGRGTEADLRPRLCRRLWVGLHERSD